MAAPNLAEYYDLNGVRLKAEEITIPDNISEADRNQNFPDDDYPGSSDWLSDFRSLFTGMANAIRAGFNSFNGFMNNYGVYLLIAALVLAGLIVLAVFAPAVFPILGLVIKGVFTGLAVLVSAPYKAVRFLFDRDK
jgi:hypothetical protein